MVLKTISPGCGVPASLMLFFHYILNVLPVFYKPITSFKYKLMVVEYSQILVSITYSFIDGIVFFLTLASKAEYLLINHQR